MLQKTLKITRVMRSVMKIAAVAVMVMAVTLGAQAQRDWSKAEVKLEKLADGLYMLTGVGGNIAVSVGEDGVLIVDDQYAPMVPKIQEAIRGVTDKPVRFVLNTHWHGDHTGGNEVLAKAKAEIIAHENVRKRMESGSPNVHGSPVPASPQGALPIITFDRTLTVHINGEDIRALHFAKGHTDGDSIIFFTKANVVHMGDHFFNMVFPFVDVDSGGNIMGLIENVEKAMAAVPDDVKVIPGHGALATKKDALEFVRRLKDIVAIVQAGIKKGKTLAQMKAEKVLAKYDDMGKFFIKNDEMIEVAYNELTAKKVSGKKQGKQHH
jgi:cyclase